MSFAGGSSACCWQARRCRCRRAASPTLRVIAMLLALADRGNAKVCYLSGGGRERSGCRRGTLRQPSLLPMIPMNLAPLASHLFPAPTIARPASSTRTGAAPWLLVSRHFWHHRSTGPRHDPSIGFVLSSRPVQFWALFFFSAQDPISRIRLRRRRARGPDRLPAGDVPLVDASAHHLRWSSATPDRRRAPRGQHDPARAPPGAP